jgi:hypothetical protein
MRPDAEKLLRRLVLLGVLREETSRQEQYQSIVSVVRVNQVRLLRFGGEEEWVARWIKGHDCLY